MNNARNILRTLIEALMKISQYAFYASKVQNHPKVTRAYKKKVHNTCQQTSTTNSGAVLRDAQVRQPVGPRHNSKIPLPESDNRHTKSKTHWKTRHTYGEAGEDVRRVETRAADSSPRKKRKKYRGGVLFPVDRYNADGGRCATPGRRPRGSTDWRRGPRSRAEEL